MKITVQTKEFQDALTKLLKVTAKKGPLAVMEGIKIEAATGGGVVLTASDYNSTASISLKEYSLSASGAFVMQKETIKLIQKMKSDELTIMDNKIVSGSRTIQFSGMDAEAFPFSHNSYYGNQLFTVPMPELLNIIDIRYACSDKESTPVLTGICFRGYQAIACDRHRLAVKQLPYEFKQDVILQATALNAMQQLVDKKFKGEVAVIMDDSKRYMNFKFDNVTFQARIIDGTYPDVSKIIPTQSSCTITVNRNDLLDELNMMKECTDSKTKTIKLHIVGNTLNLSVGTADNILDSQLDIRHTGDGLSIAFNVDFLIEGLRHTNKEEVTFSFTGANTPAMIGTECLVLPYRLGTAA